MGWVDVIDLGTTRQLRIDGQVQGSVFHEPPASIVDSGLSGPGPVSAAPYTLGWQAAGAHKPTSHALMLGLGSGAGVVAFLFDYPGRIDVVEYDATIIQAALESFPLLQYFIDQGRLAIHHGDAADFVRRLHPGAYDVIFHDTYDGKTALTLGGPGFFGLLARVTPKIWVNFIGAMTSTAMAELILDMTHAGVPPRFAAVLDHSLRSPFGVDGGSSYNWIVSSEETNPEILDAMSPYADLDRLEDFSPAAVKSVEYVREIWELGLRTAIEAEEMVDIIGALDG